MALGTDTLDWKYQREYKNGKGNRKNGSLIYIDERREGQVTTFTLSRARSVVVIGNRNKGHGSWTGKRLDNGIPRSPFMWATAIRSMVNLSGFLARAEHVGTMSDSSVMYAVILFLRRRSISLWFSLWAAELMSVRYTIGYNYIFDSVFKDLEGQIYFHGLSPWTQWGKNGRKWQHN